MTETSETRLGIAIQKSGRLAETSLELLEKCGIRFRRSKDNLFCRAENFPLDIYFVRDDDIPAFVAQGVCEMGIVGQNVLAEKAALEKGDHIASLETLRLLGFGKCRLSIAVPQPMAWGGPKALDGLTIATSYSGLLKNWLKEHNVKAGVISMEGAVEIAPKTKLADAICDLVSTGATLKANDLKETAIIFESQSVLVRQPHMASEKDQLLSRLLMRIDGVLTAQESKYIMLHCAKEALPDIENALPGAERPTVLPLAGQNGRVAVHAVCQENVFWDTMESLKSAGASAILVLPIEKMLA